MIIQCEVLIRCGDPGLLTNLVFRSMEMKSWDSLFFHFMGGKRGGGLYCEYNWKFDIYPSMISKGVSLSTPLSPSWTLIRAGEHGVQQVDEGLRRGTVNRCRLVLSWTVFWFRFELLVFYSCLGHLRRSFWSKFLRCRSPLS